MSQITGRTDRVTHFRLDKKDVYVKATVLDEILLSDKTNYNVWRIEKASKQEFQ